MLFCYNKETSTICSKDILQARVTSAQLAIISHTMSLNKSGHFMTAVFEVIVPVHSLLKETFRYHAVVVILRPTTT